MTGLLEPIAYCVELQGRVQGIGLRPAIYRWAQQCNVHGEVRNTCRGVKVHVEGFPIAVEMFFKMLDTHLPHLVEECEIKSQPTSLANVASFSISTSQNEGESRASVPLDRAICQECLLELFDTRNRRYMYPFISCANCGPRYSILERMPYDRGNTTMATFPLCRHCESEYYDPWDRRFHAQTIACHDCGPRLQFINSGGEACSEPIASAIDLLRRGGILALKGIGGWQLLVDATSNEAIIRLRQRKHRPTKSLAVMVTNLVEAEQLAVLSQDERKWLTSPENPIVIVTRKPDSIIATKVAPGLNTLGLFLPTSPVHAILLRSLRRPLVVTSGNQEGEPLVYDACAFERLFELADGWLDHDRAIIRPIDDSVLRVIDGRPCMLRLARGIAPLQLQLPESIEPATGLATGGEQKGAIALRHNSQVILGPHIGDLHGLEVCRRWHVQMDSLSTLYHILAESIAYDRHPDYYSTRWAQQKAMPSQAVLHHQAHVASVLLAEQWLDRPVLGFAWDGTGWGDDGQIWGGEAFLVQRGKWERVATLVPFALPGGEQAVKQPWRVAMSLLAHLEPQFQHHSQRMAVSERERGQITRLAVSSRWSPRTTSVGRLFDGIAALVIARTHVEYDGQAAMELESACDMNAAGSYSLALRNDSLIHLDWKPLLREILRDLEDHVPSGTIAMRFHRSLAKAIVAIVQEFPELPVALSGGVFQNAVLTSLVAEALDRSHRPWSFGGLVPPGDGGLAAGQIAWLAVQNHLARRNR